MSGTPLISIILPVYNVELYLVECLESVLNQTYQNFELIAVDDGSRDKSSIILKEYKERFANKLIIIEQMNKGLSAARNTGLASVKGEYVYFLDSDDWILSDTLASCIDKLVADNSDLVVFNAKAFCDGMPEERLGSLNYTRNLPKRYYTDGLEFFADSRDKGTYIVQSCCYMYKYSPHENLRFIEGILHEDHYFSTILFLYSGKISVLEDRFFQRRVRQNSITTSSLSLNHATGYYETAIILFKKLSNDSISSSELSKYYNYLIQVGFRIESEINNGTIKLRRKIEIFLTFKKIINFKVVLKILFSNLYKRLKAKFFQSKK